MNRYKDTKKVSIFGILGNLFLLFIKAIGSIVTNSQSMISDTFNSAGDIFSSIMTYIGNKIASTKPDEDHNLGHGKAEYIFSLLISLSMILVSLKLLFNSILSLFTDYSYTYSIYLSIICIITIMVKLSLYIYTKRMSKKYNSILIQASAEDHRNDLLLSSLTLIASIFGYFGITFVDGIVGSFVAIWILIIGYKIFLDSYDVLMDKAIDEETKEEILKIVEKYDEIKKINHFNSTPIGYKYQISLTIFVDGNMTTYESHEIANKLEKEISSLDDVYLTIIHVNPL